MLKIGWNYMRDYLVFSYSHDFIMGGIESYAIRMFKWAFNNDVESVLLLRDKSELHYNWDKILKELNVTIAFFSANVFNNSLYNTQGDRIVLEKNCRYTFIAADIHCFIKIFNIRKKNNICSYSSQILYIFHPYSVLASKKNILNYPYEFFMKKVKNRGLIFMDEETALAYKKKYKADVQKDAIVRLGMEIPQLKEDYIESRIQRKKDEINILTITRMEFPFKGYVLGLIEDFHKLKQLYTNLKLIIIGNGPNVDIVKEKINELPDNVKEDIFLIGEVAYEELHEYFRKSYIYVGMGTTLLDASLTGLVSVIATDFQMENKTVGLFSEEYYNLGGNPYLCENKSFTFEEVLKDILNWSEETYFKQAHCVFDIVDKYYNIEEVMRQILSYEKDNVQLPKVKGPLLSVYDALLAYIQIYQFKHK